MSTKNKKTEINTDKLRNLAEQGGMLLMSAAVTLGMLELPDRPNNRIILPSQPAPAMASENDNQANNPIRREMEETAPHYISYNVAQRTPSRSGRH